MTVVQNMKKINRKIPGILPPPPRNEIDGKIIDLPSKSVHELMELRERQEKLLSNKSFISKLPDKGAKIQTFYNKIINVLKEKQEEEQTCRLLEKLNISRKNVIQNMEWDRNKVPEKEKYLDSDDDSDPEDVLHILSQNTATERKLKVLEAEKPLVTAEDLLKIGESPHIKYIVDKTEHNQHPKLSGQYKPYKTTKSDVHNPEKEMLRKKHKNWEVTAATPPTILHGPAKVLNIEESLKLQTEYNIHLKEVEARHAAEKLMARTGAVMAELPMDTSKFGSYRDVDSDESDPEGSDKEVHDEEPDRGGVTFTVMK